jgi:two-component system sensor histidine kinase/response regulator
MSKGKVLIVEDEKDLRDVYTIILEHAGYEVFESANGQEALDHVETYMPNLILLDIFMPVLDGKGFLQKLDIKKHPKMKIVVCSNTSDNQLMDDMIKLGADKIVTKSDMAPSDLTTLVQPYMS